MMDCYTINPWFAMIFLSSMFLGFAYLGVRLERRFPNKQNKSIDGDIK